MPIEQLLALYGYGGRGKPEEANPGEVSGEGPLPAEDVEEDGDGCAEETGVLDQNRLEVPSRARRPDPARTTISAHEEDADGLGHEEDRGKPQKLSVGRDHQGQHGGPERQKQHGRIVLLLSRLLGE